MRQAMIDRLGQLAGQPRTPIQSIGVRSGGRWHTVRLKLESANRWGSIKDRTALGLVASVADRLEDPAATLIESTSGNLGAATAAIARELNRRFIAVVDPNLSPAVAERITEAGAALDVVNTPDQQGSFLDARLARVAQLMERTPAAVWTDQYHNPANPLAHYTATAPELLSQVPGCDAVFVAVSTGGTLAGVSRYMRSHAPSVRLIAVDVTGSRVFGEPTGARLLTGIGASRPSAFLRPGDWDHLVIVEDAVAIAVCHRVRATTGISLGGSSGAVLGACVRYLDQAPDITVPVCVCPDGGAPYANTFYDTEWLKQRSVDIERLQPLTAFRRAEGAEQR